MRLTASVLMGLACLVSASGAPLSSNYVGINHLMQVSTSGSFAFPNQVNIGSTVTGGGFQAQIGAGNTLTPSMTTTVWCVDSQQSFGNGDTALANIVKLTSAGFNPSLTAYGSLTGSGTTKFLNSVGLTTDDALHRFQATAWLVSQYNGFPSGPLDALPLGGADDLRNDAIQRAIWQITYNNSVAQPWPGLAGGDITSGAPAAQTWITAAANFVNNSANAAFFNNWAVVTWGANANGSLVSPGKQTFLVQLTPEPSFYAVVGLGLAGLWMKTSPAR